MAPAVLLMLAGVALGFFLRSALAGTASPPMQVRRLTFRRGNIVSARFAPDGTIQAWDTVTGTLLGQTAGGSHPIDLMVANPAASTLVISEKWGWRNVAWQSAA